MGLQSLAGADNTDPGILDFFFQAEDGILQIGVAGVEAGALPISFPDPLLPRPRRGVSCEASSTGSGFVPARPFGAEAAGVSDLPCAPTTRGGGVPAGRVPPPLGSPFTAGGPPVYAAPQGPALGPRSSHRMI